MLFLNGLLWLISENVCKIAHNLFNWSSVLKKALLIFHISFTEYYKPALLIVVHNEKSRVSETDLAVILLVVVWRYSKCDLTITKTPMSRKGKEMCFCYHFFPDTEWLPQDVEEQKSMSNESLMCILSKHAIIQLNYCNYLGRLCFYMETYCKEKQY